MTLTVARDLSAAGIRVNTIAPGLFDTPIYGQGEAAEQFKERLGVGCLFPKRLGSPSEYASLAVELLTNSLHQRRVGPHRLRHAHAAQVT